MAHGGCAGGAAVFSTDGRPAFAGGGYAGGGSIGPDGALGGLALGGEGRGDRGRGGDAWGGSANCRGGTAEQGEMIGGAMLRNQDAEAQPDGAG
jgi:hypothetical protein